MRRTRVTALLTLLGLGLSGFPAPSGADPEAAPETVVVTKWLALDPPDRGARRPFNASAFFLRYLLDRDAPPPAEGEVVTGTLGAKAWRAVTAKEDGTVEDASGAYFHAEVERPPDAPAAVFLATLSGASALYVNGAGFTGDVCRGGYGPVPVALVPGVNRLFVIGPRGPWRLALEAAPAGAPFLLRPEDATLPDFVEGDSANGDVGFRVVSLSEHWRNEAEWDHPVVDKPFVFSDNSPSAWWPPPPLGVRKYANCITSSGLEPEVGPLEFQVRLGPDGPPTRFRIEVRRAHEARRVTFVSHIDGAAQYFGFLPPAAGYHEISTVLSLHGAGVEALGQARSYSPRPDFRIVAPTNRRPFGFDWQGWGRTDALEALWTAVGIFEADPTRTFLTGHSMGGHGAWHLAANDPDRFAAVAPSAGWCSFDTYAGGPRPRGPLAPWWDGCDGGSRTEDLVSNLAQLPLFIVHGKADDNVPFSEAEGMVKRLTEAGAKPTTLFVEGAGHWWDGEAAPGADCVDHPEIFTFFRGTPTPVEPTGIDFITVDPGIDSVHWWVTVEQPLLYGTPCRVQANLAGGKTTVRTENVRRLTLRGQNGAGPRGAALVGLTVDGQEIEVPEIELCALLAREGDRWLLADREEGVPVPEGEKSPDSCGPFKRAFGNRFVLIVGTRGTPEENREMLEVARYHSQQWWYRANGDAPVVRDIDVIAEGEYGFGNRNFILYGNRDVNAVWDRFLGRDGPVEVRRGSIRVGDRTFTGDRLGAVFVRPRADRNALSDDLVAGAFAATGPAGMRLAYGLPVFVSGVGWPDYAVFDEEYLCSGDGGVIATGWFDHRWNLQPGGYVREPSVPEGR